MQRNMGNIIELICSPEITGNAFEVYAFSYANQ